MIHDKIVDRNFAFDTLTDYADEHGDEAVKELILEWLETKMGGKYELVKGERNE